MTTESSKNGATTSSRINYPGYVGHVSIFILVFGHTPPCHNHLVMLTTAGCLLLGLGSRCDLESGWSLVVHTYIYNYPLSLHRTRISCAYGY